MGRVYNLFRNSNELSKVQLKLLEKIRQNICFEKVLNLYNLKSKSLRPVVAVDVNLTNLATRKHGSEADFFVMARVNTLCWNGGQIQLKR